MASGKATVKAVLSGDTVVLIGNATNGPPPELQLTLSSLVAPKLARNPDQTDEPFAWESREFLRKLVIGKPVSFKVEYKVDSIGRSFGTLILSSGESVGLLVAAAGMARVKSSEESRGQVGKDHEELLRAQTSATASKLGIYNTEAGAATNSIRSVKWSGFDASELLAEHKGQLVPAVIENIINGAALRCILTDSFHVITLMLAGIQCPKLNAAPKATAGASEGTSSAAPTGSAAAIVASATPKAAASQPEPFAREAKHFTEIRLLHREVKLRLEGVDKFGNFFGGVVHPAGDIAAELLKNGLAKMVDWSAAFTSTANRTALRNAEREAKQAAVRVWKGYVAPVVQGSSQLTGRVVEVASGDTVIVSIHGSGERRFNLSSIRAPRIGNARRGEKDAPWAHEAKELLRNKVVGKGVKVTIDYEKDPAPEAQGVAAQRRSFATVELEKGKKNVAELVIAEGLAEVIRHRQDEERSAHYDSLLAAEQQAKAQKKGMHSGKEAPPAPRMTDLSTDAAKAKQYQPFLSRERNLKAVVEFVYSGSRVKLYIPKENCLVNFSFAGVKTPNPARAAVTTGARLQSAQAAQPFGEEAKSFVREHLMQRNVEIEVEDMDRGGNAFGPLFVGQGDKRKNFAVDLLNEGLAYVDEYSVDRTKFSADLVKAETDAKAVKKGLWSLQKEEPKNVEVAQPMNQVLNVKLSEVVNGGHVYIHVTGDQTLKAIEQKMAEFTEEVGTKQGAPVELKRNLLCAAQFDDGKGPSWFRAKVEAPNVAEGGRSRVRFIDYGNVDVVGPNRLRPLDASYLAYPAQAKECVIAYLRVPSLDEDYGREAAVYLSELGWGKSLIAKVHSRDSEGRLNVTFYDEEDPTSLSEYLVSSGLARVDKQVVKKKGQDEFIKKLIEAQEYARKSRVSMWQYGDVDSDDEDDEPARKNVWGAKKR